MKSSHKMEFSKKILIVAAVINIAVIIFSCYMMWKTCDLSPLAYLLPSVGAEVSVGTGFYYAKAKVENKIKLMKEDGVEPNDTNFTE